MAEGGVYLKPTYEVPPHDGENPPDEINSIHMLFARELVEYVMRSRVPRWRFYKYCEKFHATPFSYRIRRAADHYLNKEWVNFESLFCRAFKYERLDYMGFSRVIQQAFNSVYGRMSSCTDLLRFLFMFALYTWFSYKRGVRLAPYFSVINMTPILEDFALRRGETQEIFYGKLGYIAEKLMHENKEPLFPAMQVDVESLSERVRRR